MLKKISSHRFFLFFFFIELKYQLSHFLKYASFLNTMDRSSFYQLPALVEFFSTNFFLLREIHSIKFSFTLKFINSSFLLNMNFPFMQSSCFYNKFFLSSKLVSYNHFKRPKSILITRQNMKLN